ncbi:MAG: AAA family ATPase [Clostridiaceae bacterium]|nr:AAA family ATPase [Clostridiaceae bacterium]
MKIKLLDIKGFGKFNQLRIEPNEGFNIIFENNESGKTTLQAFIRAMLYGQKGGRKSKDGSLPPQRHFKPWNSEQYAGILEYTLDNGKSYRVGRNFEKGTVHIYDDGANDLTSSFPQSKDTGPQFAEEHLGIDEAAFERSAFISQLQSVIDEDGKKNLIEKLSNLNTTGSEELSLSAAIDAIESTLLERVGTKTSSTRPLNKINNKLLELEEEKSELEELNERYLETFSSLKEQKSLLNSLNEELSKLMEQKEARKTYDLLMLKKELHELLEENSRKDESIKECNRSIIRLKSFENIDESSIPEQMQLLYEEDRVKESLSNEQRRLKELNDLCEELENTLDPKELFDKKIEDVTLAIEKFNEKKMGVKTGPVRRERPSGEVKQSKAIKRSWLPFIIPAGFFSALLMIGYYILKHDVLFLGLGLLTAFATATIYLVNASKQNSMARKSFEASEELNRALAEAGFTNMMDFVKYRETQNNNRERLNNYFQQIKTIEELIENLSSKIKEYEEKWDSFKKKCGISDQESEKTVFLGSLKQGVESLKNAKEKKKLLLAEKDNINDKCEIVLREAGMLAGEVFLTPADFDNYVSNLNIEQKPEDGDLPGSDLDDAIKSVEGRIKDAQLRIAALKAKTEDAPAESELSRVIEEISQYKEKKAALEFKGSSLVLASQILKEVALKMQKDYIPELNKEMSRMVEVITSGRYSNISTNDKLRINLEVPETEELIPVSRLSGGTIDQVYLSMRLAAVSLMERGREKLPLFLDEPFSQYDEERVKKAFELLKNISNERQIFFFTCREREYELALAAFGSKLNRIRL